MSRRTEDKARRSRGASQAAAPTGAAWRFYALCFGLCVLFVLLLGRALQLQVLDTERGYRFLQGQGAARTIRTAEVSAGRGMIVDRHGEPLAVSTPVISIWAEPEALLADKDRWPELAKSLGVRHSALSSRLDRYRDRQFVYLRRHMSPDQARKVLALGIDGVQQQREYRRYYPAAEVVSHLVGFTNIDERGQEGLELAYNEWLTGSPGQKKVLKDLHGRVVAELGVGEAAKPGREVSLSIDLRLQYLAYRELKATLMRHKAKAGSVVMLDVKTGEVLAMVNQPSYNPNNRRGLRPDHMRNRAVTDLFEPGSTVKPLTVAAALETGRFRLDTIVNTNPGYLRVGGKTLTDPVNYGELDLASVLVKSSQVGTTKLALNMDEQIIWSMFSRVGLGRPLGTGFPGEVSGELPLRHRPIERANFAFGYGLTVSALQLAQAYSVLASDGMFRPVSLLKQNEPVEAQKVLSPKVSRQILATLERVTQSGGTGTRAATAAWRVAGKTGTVHKVGPGGYSDHRYRALFAGMAPVSKPRVVTIVAIDEPSGNRYYGGEVAAPLFSRVTENALRLLNVAPDKLVSEQSGEEGAAS